MGIEPFEAFLLSVGLVFCIVCWWCDARDDTPPPRG